MLEAKRQTEDPWVQIPMSTPDRVEDVEGAAHRRFFFSGSSEATRWRVFEAALLIVSGVREAQAKQKNMFSQPVFLG